MLVLCSPVENQEAPTACTAVIRLRTTDQEHFTCGNIADRARRELEWRRRHRLDFDGSKVDYSNLLRGDAGSKNTRGALYVVSGNDLIGQTECTAIIPRLSSPAISSEGDIFNNATDPFRDPYTVVKALTVNGLGGTVDFRREEFSASLLYYIENMFGRKFTPVLEKLTAKETTLPIGALSPQQAHLDHWLRTTYLPARDTAPSGRPVTEEYFRQLRVMGLPRGEEVDIGRAFFTEWVWDLLVKNAEQILRSRAATA